MRKTRFIAGAAIATALCALPAFAQEKQKGDGPSPGPGAQPQRSEQQPAPMPRAAPQQGPGKEMNRGAGVPDAQKGNAQRQPDVSKNPAKGASDPTPKAMPDNGPAAKSTDNKAAPTQDKNKSAEQPNQNRNKAVDRPPPDGNKAAQTPSNAPPRNADKDNRPGDRAQDKNRVQLSEQQRSTVHRDVLKERNVNRVNVNINVRVGARVPRTVHLAVLPASVVAIVPAYRAYRYFVVGEEICIVEPTTYEVVEVISTGSTVAQAPRGSNIGLVLSDQERLIVLREVDLRSGGDSTLGLGALSEGAPLPRGVRLADMPVTVIDRIPRLQGYKYFVAEQRIAIVDPQEQSVQLVIDAHEK